MLAQNVTALDISLVILFLVITAYLGYLGYRRTKTAADYMVAGRKTHPFVMAMSYGATFISTSAIVGFGGVAGLFGMSLLWLTFLNIFVGIFIAFVLLGGPTRRMGHLLDAHTFPELLGRRFQSRFIQIFAGLLIFLFMPLYSAAVMIGGSEFISTAFQIDYSVALLVFTVVTAAYVLAGGLKGVMYADTFQGCIMFFGMAILLIIAYTKLGGVVEGHRALTDLSDLVPPTLQAIGHRGWTAFPEFGFGDKKYDLWWIVVTTIVMGVGIGVLAQPQLAVRFMVVKSKRELNRAVLVGGIFILTMTGVAFTVGALSNAYFSQHGATLAGRVVKTTSAEKGHAFIVLMKKNDAGQWQDVVDEKATVLKTEEKDGKKVQFLAVDFKKAPVVLVRDKPFEEVPYVAPDPAKLLAAFAPGAPKDTEVRIAGAAASDKVQLVEGRSISVVYAKGNPDQIIPTFITTALPKWFSMVFLLTLLSAAMSTLSSQFHVMGTGIGRDVIEAIVGAPKSAESTRPILITRIGLVIGIVAAAVISMYARGEYIIARATAIFFGLCASAFLPTYFGGMFWKRMTRAGAVASIAVGFIVTLFWLLLVKSKEAQAFGVVQWLTRTPSNPQGQTSILAAYPNWPEVDPLIVALPLSILTSVIVSLLTRPPSEAHLQRCFG